MARAKFECEYCHKSFEDSHEARRRHFQGRNHKANVKLWYDSFAAHTSPQQQQQQQLAAATPVFDLRSLPPSMIPPPSDAFLYRRAEWG